MMNKNAITRLPVIAIAILGFVGAGMVSAEPDMTDPRNVVDGFISAVETKNYEAAAQFVLEDERESFGEEFPAEMQDVQWPAFPAEPVWNVMTINDDYAIVKVENWQIEKEQLPDRISVMGNISLALEQGKWWITQANP